MNSKKSPNANLEKKRGLFFQIGLLITLLVTLAVFESSTEITIKSEKEDEKDPRSEIKYKVIPVTVIKKKIPPPKPKPPTIEKPIVIKVIKDGVKFKPDEDQPKTTDVDGPVLDLDPPVELTGEPIPFVQVERKPRFPGGETAMYKFLRDNVRYCPWELKERVKGRVVVSFVIGIDGCIEDVKLLMSLRPCLDKQVINAVHKMPCWSPGLQRDKPVPVSYTLPYRFSIR